MGRENHDIRAIVVGAVLIVLVGTYFVVRFAYMSSENSSFSYDASNIDISEYPTIDPLILKKKIDNSERWLIADVRPSESFQAEHIPYSISVPLGSLEAISVENGQSVALVTSNDAESMVTARNIMERKKITYSFVKGGFDGWKKSGNQTISAGNPHSYIDQSKVTYLNADDFKKMLSEGTGTILILDVRKPDQYAANRIKGALNIPLDQIERRSAEIPNATAIVVYGGNELESFQAGSRLFDLSFFNVKTLTGNALLSASSGIPLER